MKYDFEKIQNEINEVANYVISNYGMPRSCCGSVKIEFRDLRRSFAKGYMKYLNERSNVSFINCVSYPIVSQDYNLQKEIATNVVMFLNSKYGANVYIVSWAN